MTRSRSSAESLFARFGSNAGVTMIYAIAALLLASFVGAGLMKMAGAESTSSVDFSAVASASAAAASGEIAVENWFVDNPAASLAAVQAFIADPAKTPRAILGSASVPLKVDVAGHQKYYALLTAWDDANAVAAVKIVGQGQGGSQKVASALYSCTMTPATGSGDYPKTALYLGDGAVELTGAFTVNGATYSRGPFNMQTGVVGTCYFHGPLRVKGEGSSPLLGGYGLSKIKDAVFDSSVYFEKPPGANATTRLIVETKKVLFKWKAGFDILVESGMGPWADLCGPPGVAPMNPDMWLNRGYDGLGRWLNIITANGNGVWCGNTASSSYNTQGGMSLLAGGTVHTQSGPYNLPQLLNMPPADPPTYSFDASKIDLSKAINVSTGFWGSMAMGKWLTNKYNSLSASQKWNGFMVLNTVGGIYFPARSATAADNQFIGKMIWLVKDPGANLEVYSKLFDSPAGSNVLFYVDIASPNYNGDIAGFGGASVFNGYVYVNRGKIVSKTDKDMDFQGGEYHATGDYKLENAGGRTTISFNDTVVKSYGNLGLFSSSGGGPGNTATPASLALNRLLSLRY